MVSIQCVLMDFTAAKSLKSMTTGILNPRNGSGGVADGRKSDFSPARFNCARHPSFGSPPSPASPAQSTWKASV